MNRHLYFYHLLPKGADVSFGITSLEWQYHNDKVAFNKNSYKYRNRLCDGWNIYIGRNPTSLSDEEVYNGINRFRKSDQGCNQIYMFRFPPYSKLGKQMAEIIKYKDVYEIDFEKLVKNKIITNIDYGWVDSNTDNEKLSEDYYRNISYDEYFDKYTENDPNRLLFSYMNHISVTPKDGYIPKRYIKRINPDVIYKQFHDFSVTEASTNNNLFFLSEKELDGKILQPKIPTNYFTNNGYEDNTTKRVCFAPSINKCLMALSQKCSDMILNIYVPDGTYSTYKPNVEQVPNVKITGETWITKPVKIRKIGTIHVIGDAGKNGHKYVYGNNNTAELYDWKYEWVNESLILESTKYPEEVPNEITDFLKELNLCDYGFIKNGKRIEGMNNFFNDYKSLTINEFEKYKIGVCWDYVHYEANWFKSHGYKYETFYIQVQDEDNDCPSHTYLVFYLPGSNIPYYFESSWSKFSGIEKFKNIAELHNTIKKRHIEFAQSKCDPNSYFRRKYDAESKSWEGLNCGEYMVKVSKGKVKFDESYILMESNLKSSIDKDFKSKGKLYLSQFKQIKITKDFIEENKSKYKLFRHIDSKDNGYAWLDKDNLVGISVVDNRKDYNWITAIEVADQYQGYGLGKQLLDFAVKSLNGNALSVAVDNEIALSMYKKYGFEISKASLEDVKAGRKQVYFMYLPEVMKEFVLQKVNKSTILYHGSPIQGLKYIEPRQESINKNVSNKNLVYATEDIRFAACFGTTWHDDIAKQGSWDHWNTVTMGISDKVDITKPCSIYELENDGSFIRIATKEVVSSQKIKVKREIRYKSYLDALKDTGVEVITLDEYYKRLNASQKSKYEQSILIESSIENLVYLDISKNKQKALNYLKEIGDKYDKYIDKYNGEIIVDQDTDHLVGSVLVGDTKDEGFITDLWVDKSYRGNGLGKRLLDDAVKKYGGIDLTVCKDNEVAISMYKKYGFVPIEYSNKEYYWMKLRSKLDKNDKLLNEGVVLQAYPYNTNILLDHDPTKYSSASKNIKTVIFDFGDVLVHCKDFGESIRNAGVPVQYVDRLKTIWFDTEEENITLSEHIEKAKEKAGQLAYMIPIVAECSANNVMVFDYTEDLLKTLLLSGYELYYLSNWNRGSFEELKAAGVFDFTKYFKGGIVSYQVHLRKPDINIYQALLDKYNIDPSTAIFYDDKIENVEAARKEGMYAVQFNRNIAQSIISSKEIIITESTKDSISEYGTTAGTIIGSNQADSIYIVNYMQNNVFSGKKEQRLAICKKGMKDLHAFGGKYNKFHYISDLNEFENEASDIKVFKYTGKPKNSFYEIIEDTVTDTDVYRLLTGRDLPDRDFIAFDPEFVEEKCFIYELAAIQECVEAGAKLDNNIVPLRVLTETVEGRPYNYYRDIDGIFVQHELTGIRSNSYDNKDDIPKAVLDIVKRGYII